MLLYLCVVLFSLAQAAERGSHCTTPRGEKAICISILSCPGVLQLLLDESEMDFVRKSQCGYDKVPLVCCGYDHYPLGIFEVFTKVPEEIHDFSELPTDMQNCGKVPARTSPFPWLVTLEFSSKYGSDVGAECTGTLVSSQFVLTAASCLVDQEFKIVTLGHVSSSQDNNCVECTKKYQRIPVSYVIPHSYYSRKNGNNDIGLVKLEHPVVFNDHIQPICLPLYGLSNPASEANLITLESGIHEVSQKTVGVKDCRLHHPNRLITVNQICTHNPGRELGVGDPLMRSFFDGTKRWYQEGISSWGSKRPGQVAVFTRVSRYVRWVINVIRSEEARYCDH